MLSYLLQGNEGPLFVGLHWLSGSSQTWREVSNGLTERGARCAAIDLPGFGDDADHDDFSIAKTVELTIETIGSIKDIHAAPWFLMGHSMGGKLAAIIARAALSGDERLKRLCGVILVSPSPPGPEPMNERQRQKLLNQLGQSALNAEEDRSRAEGFVDENVGRLPLPPDIRDRAVRDVLRMHREALVAWLTQGSKEDWSEQVGVLGLPTILFAGTEEPALGPEAQRLHTLPHFEDASIVPMVGGGHLSPLERPAELVGIIVDFVEQRGYTFVPEAIHLGPDFSALIVSDATSPQTRDVFNTRLRNDRLLRPDYVLDMGQRLVLGALTSRVVPGCNFDLADRIHQSLAEHVQDGWRHSSLPADLKAWQMGLTSLDRYALREFGVPFVALGGSRQDEMLMKVREGHLGQGLLGSLHLGDSSDVFDQSEMQAWFEDVRGELIKLYIADPRTMERIGFTGFADEHGFTQIALDHDKEVNS